MQNLINICSNIYIPRKNFQCKFITFLNYKKITQFQIYSFLHHQNDSNLYSITSFLY